MGVNHQDFVFHNSKTEAFCYGLYIASLLLIDILLDELTNRRLIHGSYLTSVLLSSTNFYLNRIEFT